MNLYCEDCKTHTDQAVRTWQTDEGIRGAVSVMCPICDKLLILELKNGYELNLDFGDEE